MFSRLSRAKGIFGKPASNVDRNFQLQTTRQIWPLVGAGIAIYAVSTVANYAIRAHKRMQQGDIPTEKEEDDYVDPHDVPQPTVNYATGNLIGVDIGTSFSRISCTQKESRVNVIENNEGLRQSPSVVFVDDNVVVAADGSRLYRRWARSPSVVEGCLLGIGLQSDFKINGDHIADSNIDITKLAHVVRHDVATPMLAYSAITRCLHKSLTDRVDGDMRRAPAVLSVPNFFSDQHMGSVITSARTGGLNAVKAVPDAVCALLGADAQGILPIVGEGRYLVVDVGGRLTQVAVVEAKDERSGGGFPVIVAQKSLLAVGGDFCTELLAQHLGLKFALATGIDLLQDPQASQRLHLAAEGAKADLSAAFSTKIHVPFITADRHGPKHLDVTLTRAQMREVLKDQIDPLSGVLQSLLAEVRAPGEGKDAKGAASGWMGRERVTARTPLKGVLLVGGGARMAVVREAVTEAAGPDIEVVVAPQPEELAVVGAAIAGRRAFTA